VYYRLLILFKMRRIVKDSRKGEALWKEWTGQGFDQTLSTSVVFFTDDHVDMENEVVRRALASALQRDGISISLGHGYKAVESAVISNGYAGEVDGDIDLFVCDEQGETPQGDIVDDVVPVTWVEVLL
jgi:ABC-type transport system substrate-binding protein